MNLIEKITFSQVIIMEGMEHEGIPQAAECEIGGMFDRKTDVLVFTRIGNYEAVNVVRLQLSRCDKGVPFTLL
jgi:hypothetical protein